MWSLAHILHTMHQSWPSGSRSPAFLALSPLAFRNVCWLSTTAGGIVGFFTRLFYVQRHPLNLSLNPGGWNLKEVPLCCSFLSFSLLLLATPSITLGSRSYSCRMSCYVPQCCLYNLALATNRRGRKWRFIETLLSIRPSTSTISFSLHDGRTK